MYRRCKAVSCQKYIWLGGWEENVSAISFYKKNGFAEFDKYIFRLGDDDQTDIMMRLHLWFLLPDSSDPCV